MKTYIVEYVVHTKYNIAVRAESEKEAESMAFAGWLSGKLKPDNTGKPYVNCHDFEVIDEEEN